jgi:hypothetical protein
MRTNLLTRRATRIGWTTLLIALVSLATNNEFIGFYTSAHATGFFNLTRTK